MTATDAAVTATDAAVTATDAAVTATDAAVTATDAQAAVTAMGAARLHGATKSHVSPFHKCASYGLCARDGPFSRES